MRRQAPGSMPSFAGRTGGAMATAIGLHGRCPMQVEPNLDGTISLPDTLYGSLTGTCFIDGIALPGSSSFRSAAVVGGPALNKGMGVIAYHHNNTDPPSGQCEVHIPPASSDWPLQGSVQAVCGVSGGMAAFATSGGAAPCIRPGRIPWPTSFTSRDFGMRTTPPPT